MLLCMHVCKYVCGCVCVYILMHRGYRGLWVGVLPLMSGRHPSSKSLTCGSKRHAQANRFSWRAKPCEGVVLTRHHWAKDLLDAGHRPGRKNSQTSYNDQVFATKASHLDGGHRLWSDMERDGLCHATSAPDTPHDDDNHYSTHTGSAVARVTKGRAFRCIPGRRWKVRD